jgi:hypothetical protein
MEENGEPTAASGRSQNRLPRKDAKNAKKTRRVTPLAFAVLASWREV